MTSITLASITTNLLLLGIMEHPNVQRLPELLVVLVEQAQQPKGLSHPVPVSVFKYIDKNSFCQLRGILSFFQPRAAKLRVHYKRKVVALHPCVGPDDGRIN